MAGTASGAVIFVTQSADKFLGFCKSSRMWQPVSGSKSGKSRLLAEFIHSCVDWALSAKPQLLEIICQVGNSDTGKGVGEGGGEGSGEGDGEISGEGSGEASGEGSGEGVVTGPSNETLKLAI